jgi:hypothetical protein
MLSKRHFVRTLALSLVLAMAGFCYAVNTAGQRSTGAAAQAGDRAVGSNTLHFTNALFTAAPPLATDTFDLGDACFGSQITRYLSAGGGLRPYNFSEFNQSLVSQLTVNSSLGLSAGGCLEGSIVAGSVTPLVFQAVVSDSAAVSPFFTGGNFRLNVMICAPNDFRFAVDKINNGVVGQSYISKLEVLGGNHQVTFSMMPNTLTVNGQPKGNTNSLDAIGLNLAADGTITGRPLQPGNVSFVARATDSIKRIALDRANAVQDQLVTFSIEDNNIVASDFTTISVSVKGDVGQFNKDTVKFSGYVNASGGAIKSLNGSDFMFVLGGATFKGRFNEKGQVVNDRGGPLVFEDGSRMVCTVNSRSGQISGLIVKASLSKRLDAINITDRSTRRYSVGVGLCAVVHGSDILDFVTKRSGDKFQLDYKLGKLGSPLAGGFQIIGVKGSDKLTVAGLTGVQWATKFLAIPRFGIDANAGLDALDSINVRIGTRFNQKLTTLTSNTRGDTTFSTKFPGESVAKLQLNSRNFRGQILTNPLSAQSTGIKPASEAAGASLANFTLGLDLDRKGSNADFSGEASKHISTGQKSNRKPHAWVDAENLR